MYSGIASPHYDLDMTSLSRGHYSRVLGLPGDSVTQCHGESFGRWWVLRGSSHRLTQSCLTLLSLLLVGDVTTCPDRHSWDSQPPFSMKSSPGLSQYKSHALKPQKGNLDEFSALWCQPPQGFHCDSVKLTSMVLRGHPDLYSNL